MLRIWTHSICLLVCLPLFFLACSKEPDRHTTAAEGTDWNLDPGSSDELSAECTSPKPNQFSPPAGIIGGQEVIKGNWLGRGVVFLMQSFVDESGNRHSSICSASMIDRNILITAAHCVDRSLGGNTENLSVYFTNKPECEKRRGQLNKWKRRVEALRVHPLWSPDQISLAERGDIAMIRIQGRAPIDYSPLTLAWDFIPLAANTPVLVSGFGMVNPDYFGDFGGDIALRFAQVLGISSEKKLSLLDQSFMGGTPLSGAGSEFDNGPLNEMLYIDQSQGKGICGGDSGGPSLMKGQRGQDLVTGVASFVMNPENSNLLCGYVAAHTSVVFYRDWISSAFQEMRNADSERLSPFE